MSKAAELDWGQPGILGDGGFFPFGYYCINEPVVKCLFSEFTNDWENRV